MSQNHILKTEVDCWAKREVRYYQPVWDTPVLMNYYHVSHSFSLAKLDKVVQGIPSPVDPFGSW